MLQDMSNSLPSPPPRKKKPQAENWDDDFEFALPSSSKKGSTTSHNTASTSASASSAKGKEKDENVPLPSPVKGRDSPTDDWDEDWDQDSPPRPLLSSPPATARHERKKSSIPPPLSIPPNPYVQPPRLSPSQTASLPTPSPLPTSGSSYIHQPLLPARSHTSLGLAAQAQGQAQGSTQPRSRSGSTTATGTVTRNKLVKRHPSTSFVPLTHRSSSNNLPSHTFHLNASDASLSSVSFVNRSSPNLSHPPVPVPPLPSSIPRSTSGEMMPPPPLPSAAHMPSELDRRRSRSKSKSRPGSRQEARVSGLPFSPSRDDMREKEQVKKPGFWKRFSGAPTVNRDHGTPTQHRRRRSSSVGANVQPASASPQPPVPPLPSNLRSPSATSSTSTSSNRSGPTSAFSALLRRSSSSLSKRSDKSRDPPPSAYHHTSSHGRTSSSSVTSYNGQPVPIPSRRGDVTPDLPSSQSFSRGFHLPSPSPGSPYHSKSRMTSTAYPGRGIVPPLPHSSSFPGPQGRGSGSDTETEGEGKTPKRRKKIRPVSALPAPTTSGKGWGGDSWKGLPSVKPHSASPHISGLPTNRESSLELSAGDISNISSTSTSSGFASTTSSTLRRLGSLSKKHGRRLSGGFKFGTNSSASSGESRSATRPLDPVLGSPSKPSKVTDELPISPTSPTPAPSDEALKQAIRAGSISVPTSMFMPMAPSHSIRGLDDLTHDAQEDADMATSMEDVKKQDKHRRRQSWNDFIIPREVMAKQKELRENIGAVKMFATGVASLKTLLSTHAEMRETILSSGTPSDEAHFSTIEAEFAQWLEMATVLIEVGSTGADPSTQPSFSSPPRSRRVTLASDEAKAASAAMSKAISAPGGPSPASAISPPVQLAAWRKTSLPDPDDVGLSMSPGPPRAEFPEQWRASTGRQDLSKRQLEVLRTMLRTPVTSTPGRPGMPSRTASTLSASSTATSFLQVSPDRLGANALTQGRATRARSRTPESISFPSPGDSAHVIPSASFPSPLSAAKMGQPPTQMRSLKERRASKAGLAGLKEFLRSLKKDRTPSGGSSGPTTGGGLSPMRIKTRFSMGIGMKNSNSPPASPTSPLNPAFSRSGDGVFYPTQRTSFSALGAGQPPLGSAALSSQTSQGQSRSASKGSRSRATTMTLTDMSNPSSASNSPRLGSDHKRPSIRNIFRTSSGNWSELVKDSPNSSSPNNAMSPPASGFGSPSGFGGLTKKLSAHRLATLGSSSGTPKPASNNGLGSNGSRVSVSDPMPSRMPIPASASSSTISSNLRARQETGFSPTFRGDGENEMEMTLKPAARKRVSGLGLGLGWPESPVKSASESTLTKSAFGGSGRNGSGGVDEMGTVFESSGMIELDHTLRPGQHHSQTRRQTQVRSKGGDRNDHDGRGNPSDPFAGRDVHLISAGSSRIPSYDTSRSVSSNTTHSATCVGATSSGEHQYGRLDRHGSHGHSDHGDRAATNLEDSGYGSGTKYGDTNDDKDDMADLTVALTPENLPTLLEYLRQCEIKLGEWRGRVEGIVRATGVGAV